MSTATTAQFETAQDGGAREARTALPLRNDTFLGVFEAIGEDLGFNANWLRIPFAALLLWNPTVILGCYLGLGAVVALSRWYFPPARKAPARVEGAPAAASAPSAENRDSEDLLAA